MTGGRPSWIVVPAKDEATHVGACLDALRTAAGRAPGEVRVVLVDDGSTDRTRAIAEASFGRWKHESGLRGVVMAGPAAGVGWARRVGIEHAMAEAAGDAFGPNRGPSARASHRSAASALIATTDADSRVDPAWLAELHARLDAGHAVIAGDVHLEASCDSRLVAARAARLATRLAALPPTEMSAPHPHFAGSNLGFALEALVALGPLPTPAALEDQAILERCRAQGIAVLRDADAIVVTSARTVGRAPDGLAEALANDLPGLSASVA